MCTPLEHPGATKIHKYKKLKHTQKGTQNLFRIFVFTTAPYIPVPNKGRSCLLFCSRLAALWHLG